MSGAPAPGKITGQAHHMLVSCYGKNWKRVNLVMCRFTAYLDDAGTDPNQKIAIATALVIPAARLIALENEWDRLKEKEGFSDFHMSEFSSPTPPSDSQFLGWDRIKHERVYGRARQITKKYGVQAISFAVIKKDYDEVVPQDMRKDWGESHYTWAVRNVLSVIDKWNVFHGIEKPFEFMFDWEKPGSLTRKEIEEVMAQSEEITGRVGLYANVNFRQRKTLPGLQCVDCLGWVTYQLALKAFFDRPLVPDAKVGWDDFRHHRKDGWRITGSVKRHQIEQKVREYQLGGEARQFFDQWRTRKPRNK
jgi:hypothetical protein